MSVGCRYCPHSQAPTARKDYGWLWGRWLETGDTIASAVSAISPTGTLEDETNSTTESTVFVEGLTLGNTYYLATTVTTADGRVEVRTHIIRCEQT